MEERCRQERRSRRWATTPSAHALVAVAAVVALAACGEQRPSPPSATGAPSATAAEGAAPARAASPPAPLRFSPCAAGMRCARLVVPLDREGRRRGSLSLRVALSRASRPPGGDVVLLSGGPGQPAVPLAKVVRERLRPALHGRRLVLLDQRGTGKGALRCPALQAAMGTSDLTVPPPSAVTRCARRLGPRRDDFTTADTVADLDALRAALGDRRWAIGGVSYGSFVAARYALAHPDRVSSLYLDSVVPHAGVDAIGAGDFGPVARVLRLACRRAGGCPSDPASDLLAVLRREGGGPALMDTVTALSIGRPKVLAFARALRAARAGDRRPLRRLERAVRAAQRAPAAFLSQGLHAATLCAESRFPWRPDTPTARRPALARAAAAARAGDTLFDAATARGNGFTVLCAHWPPTPPQPPVPERLPAVPTLLLAGDEDLSTPLGWAREEAAAAPDGRLVVVHGAGHSTLLRHRGRCPRRALARLLAGRELPASC